MSKPKPDREGPERGRFSAKRKTDAVVRLLRGEDLDSLSQELGVTTVTLSSWRDAFLNGGLTAVESRPAGYRDEVIARLQAKVGQPGYCRWSYVLTFLFSNNLAVETCLTYAPLSRFGGGRFGPRTCLR